MTYRVVLKSKATGRIKTIWSEQSFGSHAKNEKAIKDEYSRKWEILKIVVAS